MKTAVVTGVSTGIGRQIAETLVTQGYMVFGSVRSQRDATRVTKEIGKNFKALVFDVTREDEVLASVKTVKKYLGNRKLDALVNNAGIAVIGSVQGLTSEEFKHQFDVNLMGVFHCVQAYADLLGADQEREGQSGKIINISSVSGKTGMPFMSAYNMSKFGLEGFSEALRREFQFYGIDVAVIAPGPVKTPIWEKFDPEGLTKRHSNSPMREPLQRMLAYSDAMSDKGCSPARIADCVVDILSNRKEGARYTIDTTAGQQRILSILPTRMGDRMIGSQLGLRRK